MKTLEQFFAQNSKVTVDQSGSLTPAIPRGPRENVFMRWIKFIAWHQSQIRSIFPLAPQDRAGVRVSFPLSEILRHRIAFVLSSIVALHFTVLGATGTLLRDEVRKQEHIQKGTAEVGARLNELVSEFERNGLAGEELDVLLGIRRVLSNLSDKDMQKVLKLLQSASQQPKINPAALNDIASAYAGQKGIILQLRQLIFEHQRQQQLADLAVRFEALAERQSINIKDMTSFQALMRKQQSYFFEERASLSLQLQKSQQISIRDEAAMLMEQVGKLVQEADGAISSAAKSAQDKSAEFGMPKKLEMVVRDIDSNRLVQALDGEKLARDLFLQISRILGGNKSPQAESSEGAAEIDRLIQLQSELIERTRQLGRKTKDGEELQTRQGDLMEETAVLDQQIKGISGPASEQLQKAVKHMGQAKEVLAEKMDSSRAKREAALGHENQALASLQSARNVILDQMAKLPTSTNAPIANLSNLLADVQNLKKEQQDLAASTSTNSPSQIQKQNQAQADLKSKAASLQQVARLESPAAAESIGEAVIQMGKTEQNLNKNRPSPATQQAAAQALARAEEQLKKDLAENVAKQKDLEQLEKVEKELASAIQEEQKLQTATAKAASGDNLKPLQQRQISVQKKLAEMQQKSANASPQAATQMQNAGKEMQKASEQLGANQPRPAQQSEQKALDSLYQAQTEVRNKVENLQRDLKTPHPPAQDYSNIAKSMERAQESLSKAMEGLQPSAKSLAGLQAEQKELADQIKQEEKNLGQPAEGAAKELENEKLNAAIDQMKASQKELDEAAKKQPAGQKQDKIQKQEKKQGDLVKKAEQIRDQKSAIQDLENASDSLNPLASGSQKLPPSVQNALQEAQSSLAKAIAEAAQNQKDNAQSESAEAQEALSKALASLSLAQSGLASQQPGPPGQKPGKGKGKGDKPGEDSSEQGKNSVAGSSPEEGGKGDGNDPASLQSTGRFIGLPRRDRNAIQQSQAEKYPQEYAPAIEQYLRNIAEDAGTK